MRRVSGKHPSLSLTCFFTHIFSIDSSLPSVVAFHFKIVFVLLCCFPPVFFWQFTCQKEKKPWDLIKASEWSYGVSAAVIFLLWYFNDNTWEDKCISLYDKQVLGFHSSHSFWIIRTVGQMLLFVRGWLKNKVCFSIKATLESNMHHLEIRCD